MIKPFHSGRSALAGYCAWALPALVLLSGCHDHSSSPNSQQPETLTINQSTAPAALLQVWLSTNQAPRIISQLAAASAPNYTVGSCLAGGTATPTLDDNDQVTSVTFDQCHDNYGPSYDLIENGILNFEYDGGGTLSTVTASNYSQTLQLGTSNSESQSASGVFQLPDGGTTSSYSADGSLENVNQTIDDGNEIQLGFQQFSLATTDSGSGGTSDLNGQILLPASGLYVDISTEAGGLTTSPASQCPIAGTLYLDANDGSDVSVVFSGEDHITVTVNGVAGAEQTCSDFLASIGYSISPP